VIALLKELATLTHTDYVHVTRPGFDFTARR
jgi:hypothetical protein